MPLSPLACPDFSKAACVIKFLCSKSDATATINYYKGQQWTEIFQEFSIIHFYNIFPYGQEYTSVKTG